MIWKLDRSLADLGHVVNEIQGKGAGLLSFQDNIDTTIPKDELTFHTFAAITEFEREIIRERTKAGLEPARARGRSRPWSFQRGTGESRCRHYTLSAKAAYCPDMHYTWYLEEDIVLVSEISKRSGKRLTFPN